MRRSMALPPHGGRAAAAAFMFGWFLILLVDTDTAVQQVMAVVSGTGSAALAGAAYLESPKRRRRD